MAALGSGDESGIAAFVFTSNQPIRCTFLAMAAMLCALLRFE